MLHHIFTFIILCQQLNYAKPAYELKFIKKYGNAPSVQIKFNENENNRLIIIINNRICNNGTGGGSVQHYHFCACNIKQFSCGFNINYAGFMSGQLTVVEQTYTHINIELSIRKPQLMM
jgi:hypothetical protein